MYGGCARLLYLLHPERETQMKEARQKFLYVRLDPRTHGRLKAAAALAQVRVQRFVEALLQTTLAAEVETSHRPLRRVEGGGDQHGRGARLRGLSLGRWRGPGYGEPGPRGPPARVPAGGRGGAARDHAEGQDARPAQRAEGVRD